MKWLTLVKREKNACPASTLFQCSLIRSDAADAAATDHKATPPPLMKNARRAAPPVIRPPNAAADHQFVGAQLYLALPCECVISNSNVLIMKTCEYNCFSFVFLLTSGCWSKVKNVERLTNYFTNHNNLDKCKQACEKDTSCKAVDWWIKSSYCIMQFLRSITKDFPWKGYVT